MRGTLAALLAALAAAAVAATGSPAATVTYARADATVAIVGDKAFGPVTVRRSGSDATTTSIGKGRVSVGSGEASATASEEGPTALAAVTASDVDLLGGRVQARTVTRSVDEGGEPEGEVVGLRIDGLVYGPIRKPRTFDLGDGAKLALNDGDTALRLTDGSLEVAIARVSTSTFDRTVQEPDPTPSPKPKATRTPKATATPSPKPKKPTTPPRLTAGGYAFPVVGDVTFTDDWGAPRATTGTHVGNDIFAEFGSPAVAVADGRITKVGTLDISGNRLWLITDDGDAFFYAHLSSFSNAARNGNRVKAGEVLGFIGNTGDAEPTPPHLHFQVHPGGLDEDPVNPYPIVSAWQADEDVPPGAWVQQLGADATERPGALVTVRDFIAE